LLPLGQSQVRLVQAVHQHAHGRLVEGRLNRIGRGAQCLRVDFDGADLPDRREPK